MQGLEAAGLKKAVLEHFFFTCFTSTKVQMLMLKVLQGVHGLEAAGFKNSVGGGSVRAGQAIEVYCMRP